MRLLGYFAIPIVAALMCGCYRSREPSSGDDTFGPKATRGDFAPGSAPSKGASAQSSLPVNPRTNDSPFEKNSGGAISSKSNTGVDETNPSTVDAGATDSGLIESDCQFSCLVPENDAGSDIIGHVGTGTAEVKGSLTAEVIRRIIRRHINEIRCCYERELASNSDLSGRVVVNFTISALGEVQSLSVASVDLIDHQVHSCIISAVLCWTFPEPEDGENVTVTYPFILQTSAPYTTS